MLRLSPLGDLARLFILDILEDGPAKLEQQVMIKLPRLDIEREERASPIPDRRFMRESERLEFERATRDVLGYCNLFGVGESARWSWRRGAQSW